MKKHKKHIHTFAIFFLLGVFVFFICSIAATHNLFPSQVSLFKPHGTGQLRNNIRPFFGEIASKKEDAIIVKNLDGSTATIVLTNETKISGGKKSDLSLHKKISGIGSVGEKGMLTAKKIQINPQSALK